MEASNLLTENSSINAFQTRAQDKAQMLLSIFMILISEKRKHYSQTLAHSPFQEMANRFLQETREDSAL